MFPLLVPLKILQLGRVGLGKQTTGFCLSLNVCPMVPLCGIHGWVNGDSHATLLPSLAYYHEERTQSGCFQTESSSSGFRHQTSPGRPHGFPSHAASSRRRQMPVQRPFTYSIIMTRKRILTKTDSILQYKFTSIYYV